MTALIHYNILVSFICFIFLLIIPLNLLVPIGQGCVMNIPMGSGSYIGVDDSVTQINLELKRVGPLKVSFELTEV
jgi:hypothetical protein